MKKAQIVKALKELDKELKKNNVLGEINIVGGTVMCLVFNARNSTEDIDAIMKPQIVIQKAAFNVSQKLKLNNFFWINDAAKIFISKKSDFNILDLGFKNLIIKTASPEYMLAMKALSARPGTNDESDILFLIHYLNLKNKSEALKIIRKFYPQEKLKIESKILLESIFKNEK